MSNEDSNYYIPAGPSWASRTITLKSSASSRGFLLNHTCHRWAGYESFLERDFLTILLAHPDAERFQEQPEPVTYVDADGKLRTHTFDVVVYLRNGRKVAYDIKPEKRRARSQIKAIQRLISKQHPNYADKYVVRTDRQISRDRVRNAELILRARTLWDGETIEELRRHLASMHGVFQFASLVALFNEEAVGFNAVLNLIDMQELKPVTRGLFNDNTELEICKAA
ncbi:hypothetical protein [Roseibium aggregatum]|uniref:TnsA endonuclease-like protein n=1 Tax=Roseibium aggregatum TaxID=187304 RepID=A0A926NTN5_9HYPH|nr:hypothetical protein [Roseibium aggregatum]MBD1546244.1 hypothetical protein [Roseibium aggregatum]